MIQLGTWFLRHMAGKWRRKLVLSRLPFFPIWRVVGDYWEKWQSSFKAELKTLYVLYMHLYCHFNGTIVALVQSWRVTKIFWNSTVGLSCEFDSNQWKEMGLISLSLVPYLQICFFISVGLRRWWGTQKLPRGYILDF